RDFMAQHQNPMMRNFMRNVSLYGDWPLHLALGLLLLGIAWQRQGKKWMRIFLSMLMALAIAGVIGRGIQLATGRARPSISSEQVRNRFSAKYNAFNCGQVDAESESSGVCMLV